MVKEIYLKDIDRCVKKSNQGEIFASIILGRAYELGILERTGIEKPIIDFGEFPTIDLGEAMNSEIDLFYKYRFFESNNFDFKDFEEKISEFFDQYKDNYSMHEEFFKAFTYDIPYNEIDKNLNPKKGLIDEITLIYILSIVKDYENKNNVKIHKGIPYYYLGASYITEGKLFEGFSYMHQALEEDKRIGNNDSLAYRFVTLDFLYPKNKEIVEFIETKLTKYSNSNRGTLKFNNFKTSFLARREIQDIVFQFVYAVFRLKEMLDIAEELKQNDFSALSQKDIIFDFCTIIENIIKTRNKYPNENSKRTTLYFLLEFLSEKAWLNIHEKDSNDLNSLNKIKRFSHDNFHDTLKRILFKSCDKRWNDLFANKKPIEEDLLMTLILRNNVHDIKSWPIIYKNFEPIIERILDSLFFSIEKLYIRYYWNYEKIIQKVGH